MQEPKPSTQWTEVVDPDEDQRFASYAQRFAELQQRKSAKQGEGRALHRKQVLAIEGQLTVLGLKEGGVDYALDQHNAKLVSADMKKKVDAAKADIIAGKIKVADYMADNACKY